MMSLEQLRNETGMSDEMCLSKQMNTLDSQKAECVKS